MAYSTNIGRRLTPTDKPENYSPNLEKIFGRVQDIILSSSHPEFETYGGISSIGGILFRKIFDSDSSISEDDSSILFAYPASSNLKHIPLKNEIVEIIIDPGEAIDENVKEQKLFYSRIINVFNTQHNNSYPNYKVDGFDNVIGTGLPELEDITNLSLAPGDVVVEGRLGNSIRLSGYHIDNNSLSDQENNGIPYTIIKNSTNFSSDQDTPLVEDINNDDSSIYLTSDHSINLNTISNKRSSFKSGDYTPDQINTFRGRQIAIDSGRVVLHAKDDIVEVNSKDSIHLNSERLNLDSKEYTAITGKKVYLGDEAYKENQPLILGQENEKWLRELLNLLSDLSLTLSTCTTPATTVGALTSFSATLTGYINSLTSKLDSLKSKKSFTE